MPRRSRNGQGYYDDIPEYMSSSDAASLREEMEANNNNPWAGMGIPEHHQVLSNPQTGDGSSSYNWGQINDVKDLVHAGARHFYDTYDDDPYLRDKNGRYLLRKSDGKKIQNNFLTRTGYSLPNLPGVDPSTYYDDGPIQVYGAKKGSKKVPAGGGNPSSMSERDIEVQNDPYGVKRTKLGPPPVSEHVDVRAAHDVVMAGPAFSTSTSSTSSTSSKPPKSHYLGIPTAKSVGSPQIKSEGSEIFFKHSEYCFDVISSTATQISASMGQFTQPGYYKIPINASIWSTFPMLSSLAMNFTRYRISKLRVRYVSTSGEAVSGTNSSVSLGNVVITHLTNVAGPVNQFPNRQSMENNDTVFITRPSINGHYDVDVSRSPWLYCRYDPNTFGSGYVLTSQAGNQPQSNAQLTDLCNLYVGCFGSPASNTVGMIFFDYEVSLIEPVLFANTVGNQILYWRAVTPLVIVNGSPILTQNILDTVSFGSSQHGNLAMVSTPTGGCVNKLAFPITLSTGIFRITYTAWMNYTGGSVGCTVNVFAEPLVGNLQVVYPFSAGGNSVYPGIAYPVSAINNNIAAITAQGEATFQGTALPQNVGYVQVVDSLDPLYFGIVNVVYVQLLGPNAFISLQLQGAAFSNGVAVLSQFVGASCSVEQVNPDFIYSWNLGNYSSTTGA